MATTICTQPYGCCVPISSIEIYYTADVITPDPPCEPHYPESDLYPESCACSFVYGEPTEHGHGATLLEGWVDPDWSLTQVFDHREDVRPDSPADDPWTLANLIVGQVLADNDVPPSDPLWSDYETPDQWIERTITDRLGCLDSFDGVLTEVSSYYAADSIVDYHTGTDTRLAAHVYHR